MNKKLAVAILLPSLSACAGHSFKSNDGARKPSSTRSGKISQIQAASLKARFKKVKTGFEANADDSVDNAASSSIHPLRVVILDHSNAGIPGAAIQVKDSQGNITTLVSDKYGVAAFKTLTVGNYSVHAEGGPLTSAIDQKITLTGIGARSTLELDGDEKGNGTNGPVDTISVSGMGGKVIKTTTINASDLPSYQKSFSSGQWVHLGEMCKWQTMPWEENNSKKLDFGSTILSPSYIFDLSVACDIRQGVLKPRASVSTMFIQGANSYSASNGSLSPDNETMDAPGLRTDISGVHNKNSVYSFNVVEGATQSVVLKGPTSGFYFQKSDANNDPGVNAFSEDLVGHTAIEATDYSFVNYKIQEYWIVVTLDDGKNGPAKDGTAIVQKLMFLTSGKSGYPIVIKNEFSSVVDPDAFEVVVRANQIASQDPSLAQDPISAYTKAYSQAEAAQAGPEDALFSWQYYRIGTQTNAMLEKLYGDDSLQQVDLNPVNPSSNWMSNLGLALAYTKSPTNDPLSWKDDQDRTNSTAITLTTYASWFGYPPRTIGGNFGGITTNFPGALEELKNFGPTLGSGRISDAEVQSLIQEAKKNISQQSSQ